MVQYSQTSWQEFSISNLMESLCYAPMNVNVGKTPVLHYVFPKELAAGEIVRYRLVVGFKTLSWTGIVSAVTGTKVTVRLEKGPFRGFNATHEFVDEGNLTACYDSFSFQGFSDIPEEDFAALMQKASLVYAIFSRKDAKDLIMAVEAQKKTQIFEALDSAASAG